MRFIELSKKIAIGKKTTEEDLKRGALERLRRNFVVDKMQENPHGFHFSATTGDPRSMTRNARVEGDVKILRNEGDVRVLLYGRSRVAQSLFVAYALLFVMVLLVGLLPGSIDTGDDSTPMDALVFLLFGIFIFFDIEHKLKEPEGYLRAVLDSLETEFAA